MTSFFKDLKLVSILLNIALLWTRIVYSLMVCFLKNWFHGHNQWEPNERVVCIGANLSSLQKPAKAKSLNHHKLACSFERPAHDELSLMIQFTNICMRNEKWIYFWIQWVSFWETEKENTRWRKRNPWLSFLLWISVMENAIPQSPSRLLFITQCPLAFQFSSCRLSCFCWTFS